MKEECYNIWYEY